MFKAAKWKDIREVRCSKEWILECLVMGMNGPKLHKDRWDARSPCPAKQSDSAGISQVLQDWI